MQETIFKYAVECACGQIRFITTKRVLSADEQKTLRGQVFKCEICTLKQGDIKK